MSDIHIRWLSDTHDCEICGFSDAQGALVFIDGVGALDLTPSASCFDSTEFPQEEVFTRIFSLLGHTVTQAPL